jgi:hypothetical protein
LPCRQAHVIFQKSLFKNPFSKIPFQNTFFRQTGKLLLPFFLLFFGFPKGINAQICDPEADFTIVSSGCTVNFQSSFAGPGTAVHDWSFFNTSQATGDHSISDLANPRHTFKVTADQTKTVVHRIVITFPNGQVVTKTCEKAIVLNCTGDNSCDPSYYFQYQVIGCSLTILQIPGGGAVTPTWDFGDGTAPVTATYPTHVYQQNGDYPVTINVSGKPCTMYIRVQCAPSVCCSPAFAASLYRECGVLRLNLNAECNTGNHVWTVTAGGAGSCIDLVNFQPTVADQTIQITNINTALVTSLQIKHDYVCEDGQQKTETQTVNMPTPAAIFIGRDGLTTGLNDYNCTLPNDMYSGANTIYVSGKIVFTKKFTFSHSDIQFNPGETGFDITANSSFLKLLNGTRAHGVTDCDCMWRGITVKSNGIVTCNEGSSIEDAVYGIWVLNPTLPEIHLDGAKFLKNFVAIKGESFLKLNDFRNCEIDGAGPLKNICELTHDIVSPGVSNLISLVNFNTQQGFAGIYIKNLSAQFVLPPQTQKNLFNNLAFGILAFDCNLDINQNSRFTNISAEIYGQLRTSGIFSYDGPNRGNGTFRFNGSLNSLGTNALSDFDHCAIGITVRSTQSIAPTQVGITNTSMDNMRTGVFLDSRFSGGAFNGSNTLSSTYAGVRNNRIIVNNGLFSINTFNGGIGLYDLNTTASNLQIANNDVTLSYFLGPSNSVGIWANGINTVSDPGVNAPNEIDIFENRILVNNEGQSGISLFNFPKGVIRNNSGGDINSGNGIFLNSNSTSSGIRSEAGYRNTIACNDVLSISGPAHQSLLLGSLTAHADLLHNKLTGPGDGAKVAFSCMDMDFRCNEMNNNTTGLLYTDGADTGPQGTASETFGNRWVGAFTTGAEADMSVLTSNSKYYFRNINNEAPPSILGPSNWFNSANLDATINCLTTCPAPPATLTPTITHFDTLVVNGNLGYGNTPFAAERTWQNQFDLYRVLNDFPQLAQSSSVMQGFMNSMSNSNIAALIQAQHSIRDAFAYNNATIATLQANEQSKAQIEVQIHILDSLLSGTTDPVQVAALQQQKGVQDSLLNLIGLANESLANQHEAQRVSAVPTLLTQLGAISPNIVCEQNLRKVMEIYLQTTAFSSEPINSMLVDLNGIASQCPEEGGIGVYAARSLYAALTGTWINENDCTGQRQQIERSNNPSITVYPNPSSGKVLINFPDQYLDKSVTITVLNSIGVEIKQMNTSGNTLRSIDLSDQLSGLYFLVLRDSNGVILSTPIQIQH